MSEVRTFIPTPRKGIKNNYPVDYGMADFYRYYKKEYAYKKFKSKFSDNTGLLVDASTYSLVLSDLFSMITEKIIEGDQFKLPLNIGVLAIKKRKMNFDNLLTHNMLKIDYHESRKIQKVVYFTNEHTDGYRYKWQWNKRKCKIPGKSVYKFIPSLLSKRRVAKKLKNRECDYPEE